MGDVPVAKMVQSSANQASSVAELKMANMEAEILALRQENAQLKELGGMLRTPELIEKIEVLPELNDKLELDLDLALKELSINKKKADNATAELAQVQSKNAALESEIAS